MITRSLFALVAGALLIACGGAEADLEGSWKMAPEEVEKQLKKVPKARHAMLRSMVDKMKMTFEDGKVTLPNGDSGGYKVVESDGNKLTLEVTDGKDKGDKVELVVDGDSLTMTTKGQTAKFVRAE